MSDGLRSGRLIAAAAPLLLNLGLYLCLLAWTVACLAVGLPLLPIVGCLPGNRAARAARLLIWLYGKGAMLVFGLFMPVRREGEVRLPEPCIIVANHQSIWDLYCMGLLPIFDVCMVVRSWPFRMPLFSLFMRLAGYIRSEDAEAGALIEVGRKVLEGGGSLLFFPEGHRSRTGRLGHFFSGAFRLAAETGVPIVPLCIEGTGRLLPPGARLLRSSRLLFRILPPVWMASDEAEHTYLELRKRVKTMMSEALYDLHRVGLPLCHQISSIGEAHEQV